MSTPFTSEDIIESHKKYGLENMGKLELDDPKQNKDKDHPTWYLEFKIRDPKSGDYKNINLKFILQIFGSHAKIPHGQNKLNAKNLNILFKALNEEELEKSEYPTHARKRLLEQNKTFIEALTIISNVYTHLVESKLINYEGSKIRIPDPVKVFNFMQSERKATEDEIKLNSEKPPSEKFLKKGKINLEKNFYRIKIPATKDGQLGYTSYESKKFYPIVFDGRTKTKTNPKANPAKITIDGITQNLTLTNGPNFLTYLSLSGGTITFDSVCVSNSGISLITKFRELHVWPHAKIENVVINDEEYDEMANIGTSGFEDLIITEPVTSASSSSSEPQKIVVDLNVSESFEPENNN
jgi:hypothetical protein